ncbi:hypothetical protein ABEB36_002422 [Hypothenemus hampei]|uniref:Uncharacterized protein n=1 Tax=Hypothenemus hampei TaxID=57062 RepID=A0ABD1F5P1_HYPHA
MASEDQRSVPKEGGWGYMIVAATVVILWFITLKQMAFSLVKSYTSHHYLYFQHFWFSYRQVSFVGSIILLVGAIYRIFVQDFTNFTISQGFIAMIGKGLLESACLTALNSNFTKKIAFIMCLHQTVVYVFDLFLVQLATCIEEIFDPRGTLIGLALLSCFCLPASAMLRPPPKNDEDEDETNRLSLAEPNEEVVPLCDRIALTFRRLSEKLKLLKSYKYWNTIVGISLALNGDEFFFKFLPLVREAIGKESKLSLKPNSATELIFIILLTIVSAFVKLNSRLLMLFTSALVVIIRIHLVPFIDTESEFVLFECLRCFTKVPVPLVFSEEYKDNFTTAYSICMVIDSVVNFIFTGLIHAVLHCSDADKKTEYICISAYVICWLIWTLEFTIFRKKPTNNGQNLNENQ